MKKKMCMSIFRHMQYKEPVPPILENIFLTLKKMNQTFFWYLYNIKNVYTITIKIINDVYKFLSIKS